MSPAAITLELAIEHGRTAFEPGARLGGAASWSASTPPRGMELRLSWTLTGKGGRDLRIAETIPLPQPGAAERRPFVLTLPIGPYSFRGSLLTLAWALDLVAQPGEETTRVNLIIAPRHQMIELPHDVPRP
ncbi:MAG TPA: hypothetical protein VGP64_09070 [Polyangia bacterium]